MTGNQKTICWEISFLDFVSGIITFSNEYRTPSGLGTQKNFSYRPGGYSFITIMVAATAPQALEVLPEVVPLMMRQGAIKYVTGTAPLLIKP